MQKIVLVFWYVVGTAVINNMLKIHDNIPHIKGVIATRVKHKEENSKFSSRLVVAAGAAVASHPYVRVRLYIN